MVNFTRILELECLTRPYFLQNVFYIYVEWLSVEYSISPQKKTFSKDCHSYSPTCWSKPLTVRDFFSREARMRARQNMYLACHVWGSSCQNMCLYVKICERMCITHCQKKICVYCRRVGRVCVHKIFLYHLTLITHEIK